MLSPELLGFLEPFYIFIPFYIGLGFLMIVPFVIWLSKYFNKNKKRHPLTENLLRMPGQSLLIELDKNSEKLDNYLLGLFMLSFMVSSTIFYNFGSEKKSQLFMAFLMGIAFVIYLIYSTVKIIQLRKRFNELKLGFECEVAVGQELNQLMLDGYRVFHDFQADNKFNIDHIVIGNGWIFVIETKGRSKPINKKSNIDNSKLVFDGEKLIFPTKVETTPLKQTIDNATWLKTWIKKNTGEEVKIVPILTFPGWFLEDKSTKAAKPRVINPKQLTKILRNYEKREMTPELNKKTEVIVYKIEEKCRDIEPKAYKNV